MYLLITIMTVVAEKDLTGLFRLKNDPTGPGIHPFPEKIMETAQADFKLESKKK